MSQVHGSATCSRLAAARKKSRSRPIYTENCARSMTLNVWHCTTTEITGVISKTIGVISELQGLSDLNPFN